MSTIKTIEGMLDAKGLKIAIVASRFNDFITSRLLDGAVACLVRHGAKPEDLVIIKAPGAFELPLLCDKLAASQKYNGIVALGAVIRGSTPHFDYVGAECSKGIAQISLKHSLPIGFGIITANNLEQAVERAGSKAGNKGVEAALAMLETAKVLELI